MDILALIEGFICKLWPSLFEGFITIWTKRNKKTHFISQDDVTILAKYASVESESDDVYFGLGIVRDNTIKGRGKYNDVVGIPGLWLDIDIASPQHSSESYPPDYETVMEIVGTFILKPTMIINSGYGIHLYYLFSEPLIFKTNAERDKVSQLSKRFQNYFITHAQIMGYKVDNTSDLTRVLRIPSTYNYKGEEAVEVTIVEDNSEDADYRYSIEQFYEGLTASMNPIKKNQEFLIDHNATYRYDKIQKACKWVKHCKQDSFILIEPEWYSVLTIIARCESSWSVAQEVSCNHPKYNADETTQKLHHAAESDYPVSCQYIENNFLYSAKNGKTISYCDGCRYRGQIKSPLILGMENASVSEISLPDNNIYDEYIELLNNTPFLVNKEGDLCTYDKNGEIYEIANFVAKPREEIILDDGVETKRIFVIEGISQGGNVLPAIEVNAEDFYTLNWLIPKWGIAVNVYPPISNMNILRSAIQRLAANTASKTYYNHIGFRNIDGQWVYLHAGGCIGKDDISVDVQTYLSKYCLPESDPNPFDSIQASIDLLELAPMEVTLPLLYLMYLAPLNEAFKICNIEPSFILWLYGRSGTRKTSLATLFLNHFGEFSKSPPASFRDTINSLEKKSFLCKDAPLCVDDYFPSDSKREKEKLIQTAQALIRMYGDKGSKGRMNADSSLRAEYPPRGVCLTTAEDLISGHSSMARLLPVEIKKNAVDLEKLTKAQNESYKLSQAMYSYISWLIPIMDALPMQLKIQFEKIRNQLSGINVHGRAIEIIAWMQIAYNLFLKYAESVGVVEAADIKTRLNESMEILTKINTTNLTEEEKPEILYLNILLSLLASKHYSLKDINSLSSAPSRTIMLGYEDELSFYLNPDFTFTQICKELQSQGKTFPITKNSLNQALDDAGLINVEVTNNERKKTVNKTFEGKRSRYLQIYKDKMYKFLDISL
ncbi:MAG: hypothetical protein AB9835_02130 [Eubacteriales bacterium]